MVFSSDLTGKTNAQRMPELSVKPDCNARGSFLMSAIRSGFPDCHTRPAIPVPEHVAAKTVADSFQWDARFGAGQDVFDALVRQVDRIDPSYKN